MLFGTLSNIKLVLKAIGKQAGGLGNIDNANTKRLKYIIRINIGVTLNKHYSHNFASKKI